MFYFSWHSTWVFAEHFVWNIFYVALLVGKHFSQSRGQCIAVNDRTVLQLLLLSVQIISVKILCI